MPKWVLANTSKHVNALLGPYETWSKAQSIRDGLDDGHAKIYKTDSYRRGPASQEIKYQISREGGGADVVTKNFSHRGELVE